MKYNKDDAMVIFNSLSRKKETFSPLRKDLVGVYTCGPTVYDFASIGNFRTYTAADILIRMLRLNHFTARYIMNITDVGHLTGDNLGDADMGEDRIEKSAQRQNKTAWDIARFYTNAFLRDFQSLNLVRPNKFVRATDHIREQIKLIKTLESKGFAYKISDGIYFDTEAYERKTGEKYGKLSTLDQIKIGARVERNLEKRNPRDFSLWKLTPTGVVRQMEWESPWGRGFPGWHIECSAMSMKYLGETFDFHLGGEDLRGTHHPNEIAQSQAATGKQFVRFWFHTTFLLVDGKRMGKSLGNFYTLQDIKEKKYHSLALRYLYLTAHYRDPLNFTWESLASAQGAIEKLRRIIIQWKISSGGTDGNFTSTRKGAVIEFQKKFEQAMNNDLNTPRGLSVLWAVIKSRISLNEKIFLIKYFDNVLGLFPEWFLNDDADKKIPRRVQLLVHKRDQYRKTGEFIKADEIRILIENVGYSIQDTEEESKLVERNRR